MMTKEIDRQILSSCATLSTPSQRAVAFVFKTRAVREDWGKMTPTMPDTIVIGDVLYHPKNQRLVSASGEDIYLRAQSLDVLRVLVENLGEVVSRETLFDAVWPDVAVTDDSLTQCIREIRVGLADAERQLLQTVPKRGYRVLGELQKPATIAPAQPFELVREQAADTLNSSASEFLTAQLDPRDVLPTLAILPFRSDLPEPKNIFGVFLANEIARLLCMSKDANVISRMSAETVGADGNTISMARDRLKADFVLSGYMMSTGPQVALSLEFVETESGYVLWSERLQVPFDPNNPATEALEPIVANIQRAVRLNEIRRVGSRPIGSLKLFSLLHGAVGLMHRLSRDDFSKAKDLLDHLHGLVPNHPSPLANLARWHVLKSVQGWANDTEQEARIALEYTARALDIDPEHTQALVCEGQVLVHLAQDLSEAEHRYDIALNANPNDANGRALRGMLLAFSDRGQDGKRDTERGLHLTPLDPHRFFYLALAAGACLASEDYDRALALTKESLRYNKAHMSSHRMLPVAYLGAGQEDLARKAASDLMELQPDLRVSQWLRSSPSAPFKNGQRFADMLIELGVPT